MEEIGRRFAREQGDGAVHCACDRAERIMLVAQLILGGLLAVIAEVPDLMRQRGVLRVEQRKRKQNPQDMHQTHHVFIPDTAPGRQ